ncbi:unnamed protein product [Symbiodinium microadriaticum]|nr:unnamed protein product [Symbiodinium microadriaticum]
MEASDMGGAVQARAPPSDLVLKKSMVSAEPRRYRPRDAGTVVSKPRSYDPKAREMATDYAGRFKELMNRAGEKISPFEVEEAPKPRCFLFAWPVPAASLSEMERGRKEARKGGLRAAERYSNKLNGLDPSQVYQVPQEDELEESQETSEEEEPFAGARKCIRHGYWAPGRWDTRPPPALAIPDRDAPDLSALENLSDDALLALLRQCSLGLLARLVGKMPVGLLPDNFLTIFCVSFGPSDTTALVTPSASFAQGAMAPNHAALLAAAVKAACQAKAPRRTVAAIAAAVTSSLVAAAAAPATVTGAASRPPSARVDSGVRDDELVQQLRDARAERRRAKRQRRRAKKVAATSGANDQTVAVAEAASVGTAVAEAMDADEEPRADKDKPLQHGKTGSIADSGCTRLSVFSAQDVAPEAARHIPRHVPVCFYVADQLKLQAVFLAVQQMSVNRQNTPVMLRCMSLRLSKRGVLRGPDLAACPGPSSEPELELELELLELELMELDPGVEVPEMEDDLAGCEPACPASASEMIAAQAAVRRHGGTGGGTGSILKGACQ